MQHPLSVRAVLWFLDCRPMAALHAWQSRAGTAEMASIFEGNRLTLRDVLPGLAYAGFGPWTDAEQRAMAPFDASSAMRRIWSLVEQTSPDQVPSPVHCASAAVRPATGLETPPPKSCAPKGPSK